VQYTNLSGATRWGLNALLLMSLCLILHWGETILVPIVLALLGTAMLWPCVNWLHRRVPLPGVSFQAFFPWARPCLVWCRVPWGLACTFTVLVLFSLTLLVPLSLSPVIPRLLQSLKDEEQQQNVYDRVRHKLVTIGVTLDEQYFPKQGKDSIIFRSVREALDPEKPFLVPFLWQTTLYGGSWIFQWVLILFLLWFLLLEGPMLGQRVGALFGPTTAVQERAATALKDMSEQVRSYLLWRTIVNFALAGVLGLFFRVMGLREPWTWAILIAILAYIPYLGQIVGGIPPVIDAFVNCDSPWAAVLVLVVYIGITLLEGYLIVPVVMGRSLQLNATTVLLSCLFWELLWGPVGLFLAMPLMAAVKTICQHVPDWQPWGDLMSDVEPKNPIADAKLKEEELHAAAGKRSPSGSGIYNPLEEVK
jgi:predicted PurR-regulated permease PerM